MPGTFTDFVLCFAVYSVLGWVCEVIYCSIPAKKLVRRGFLAGPYCPIYGFGALALIMVLYPFSQKFASLPLVFLAAVVITSALEYFTSWLMEKMFNMRWWDYSHFRFNINGRVCLLNSLLFGGMGLVLLYLIQPLIDTLIYRVPLGMRSVIASLFAAGIFLDFVTTLNGIYKLDAKLKQIQNAFHVLKNYDEQYAWYDKKDIWGSLSRLEGFAQADKNEDIIAIAAGLKKLLEKDNSGRRLLASFDKARSITLQEHLEVVRKVFEEKAQAFHRQIASAPEKEEQETATAKKKKSFAAGLNFYKLFWVFFIACIVGYVVETLFCLVTRGYIESRQGMLYGPLNQVYGFGAVLMVLCLHKLARKGDRWVFIGSALIGGLFEAVCSYVQETMFGSTSWGYEGQQFAFFGGRTSLLFMLFWGILGVVFIKEIFSRLSRFVERIPNKQGLVLSWILVAVITVDLALSAAAVTRWSARVGGADPQNYVEELIDAHYPDDFMKTIYPNMIFKESDSGR